MSNKKGGNYSEYVGGKARSKHTVRSSYVHTDTSGGPLLLQLQLLRLLRLLLLSCQNLEEARAPPLEILTAPQFEMELIGESEATVGDLVVRTGRIGRGERSYV